MAEVDIVARLQLRAEQFSSETGQRFAELKSRARSAAQEIRSDFSGAFADVNRIASQALQMPRTSTGSLDLSAEIKQLNAAAAAAEINAVALRELSIAQTAAANTAGVNRQALLTQADAAAVASLAEEQHAQELREKIGALEAVQRELNQATSATRSLSVAEQRAAAVSNGHRQGLVMIGQQFQDFTVQVASGQSVAIAFAQNIGQLAFALNGMEGRLGAVGAFLAGPWGMALTIGTIAIAPFISKLLEGGEAADRAKEATEELADYVGDLGNYFDRTTGKIRETNQALIQYAVLTNFNRNQDHRAIQKEAAREGREALARSRRASVTSTGVYLPGSTAGTQAVRPGSNELAEIFANGPDAPGIDTRLRQIAESGSSNAAIAAEILESRAKFFRAAEQIAENDKEIRSLLTGVLDPDLKTGKPSKPKKPRAEPDLAGVTNAAEEEIARINAEWDEQPRLIDKAFLATQKLDNLIEDLQRKKPPNWQQLVDQAEAAKQTIDRGLITSLGKAFEEPQTLAEKGAVALAELDSQLQSIEARKPPNLKELIELAGEVRDKIENGINRPFREYVEQQRESLAIGELVLSGRDAEAQAMRDALQIQKQQGQVSEEQLETVLDLAEQHERIARALEDQRRIVGIYTAAVGDLQSSFERFLEDLQTRPGSALTNAVDNVLGSIQTLQRSLISNAVFGGVDRQVEDYIRRMTGRKTPAEILSDQARDAGVALRTHVDASGDALGDFVKMVRRTTAELGTIGGGGDTAATAIGVSGRLPLAISSLVTGIGAAAARATREAANDNADAIEEIVITGNLKKLDQGAGKLIKAADVMGVAIRGFFGNLEKNLGIKVPKVIVDKLATEIPTVIKAAGLGQLGGSVFASITGGKDDRLASSVGGVLGDVAGKQLGPVLEKAVGGGLGKFLGGAAGPIGAIAGGVLGSLISGLFSKPEYGTAILGSGDAVNAFGRGSSSIGAAAGMAGSVQEGLQRIADALGATIGSYDTVVGTFDGKYRVRTTASGWDGKGPLDYKGNSGNNLYNFDGDQQAAIAFAIADAVRDGAIQGLSAASSRILQSGQDLGKAIEKVVLIESIPKSLKAMLDPVGAAVDELNLKWKRTLDALKEGGASAEQMAQAQQLYNLELAQVKNSTASASQSLKDFLQDLNVGSSSPLSLRDQEAGAFAALKPFLEQINAGEAIDQDKYRQAAQTYLDVERQLHGSTQAFFEVFDAIQASTNKAIAAIDNVAPVSPAVESPFAKETAMNSAATAANTNTTNELLEQVRDGLQQLNSKFANLAGDPVFSDFIGEGRYFRAANY